MNFRSWNREKFDTNRLTPVEVPAADLPEPEPKLSEARKAEIRAMWEAHNEKQRALDEAWRAFHRAVRNGVHWKFRQERMALEREQRRLNEEREALPKMDEVKVVGVNVKELVRNVKRDMREERLKQLRAGGVDFGLTPE